MLKTLNSQRLAITATGHKLHIFWDGDMWEVWLNTEVEDFDGICIGSGKFKEDALEDAMLTLSLLHSVAAQLMGGR